MKKAAIMKSISAQSIYSRPIESVLATLLHEMVHLYCMINGIKDTSNNGSRNSITHLKPCNFKKTL